MPRLKTVIRTLCDRILGSRKTRYRDILRLAAEIEAKGMTFYRAMAVSLRETSPHGIIVALGDGEQRHLDYFTGLMRRYHATAGKRLPPRLRVLLDTVFPAHGYFSSYDETLRYALASENATAGIYTMLLKEILDESQHLTGEKLVLADWKTEELSRIIEEEEEHARKLTTLIRHKNRELIIREYKSGPV